VDKKNYTARDYLPPSTQIIKLYNIHTAVFDLTMTVQNGPYSN